MDEISDDDTFWFKVGDILEINEPHKVNDYLINKELSIKTKERSLFANKTLFRLSKIIHDDPIVNYFLEKENNLDKVLKIFIRMNSGGTELSYSDILLSIATALWRKKDAREEINALVDKINKTGAGFNFDKDFILKTCLVLSDFTDIAFKVNNFNASNMAIIEQNWDTILKAIRLSVSLISSYGYNRDTLTSNYVLIPIAYYLQKIGLPDNFHQSTNYKIERGHILKWVIMSLLKRAFGGTPDNVLRPIRQILSSNNEGFPIEDIIERLKVTTKSIVFTDDDIDNLFIYKYGNYTFSILALLYPTLDFRNKFHQDHIFPKKFFTKKRLLKYGISENKIDTYIENVNSLANLQLLEGTLNVEKAGEDFNTWLLDQYPDRISRIDYMEKHCIPDIELSLVNFDRFLIERQTIMKAKYKSFLQLILSPESFKDNSDIEIINHNNDAINNVKSVNGTYGKVISELNGRKKHEIKENSKETIQQQKYINDKMYKLSELMLMELRKTKPDKLQIGNNQINIESWSEICKYTVNWLIEKGYLTPDKLPIFNAAHKDKYFINNDKLHLNPKRDAYWKEVGDYFVDVKHDANHHIKNILYVLNYLEVPEPDIMISLRSP